ncbi:GAF domain-containing protein [Aggregatilinea lenta]|uniref:GAF domain-containing protein n=1 Tax=Aggregatilinea lenta TaxID=913108 RepID=UPI000E5AC6C7|nr:GAF domain-containing protein [Aggregatilinea lenta]
MLRRLSIRTQFLLITLFSVLLVTASLTTARVVQERRSLVEAEQDRSETIISTVNLAIQLADTHLFSFNAIPDLLPRLRMLVESNDDLEFVAVTSPTGYVYAHSQRESIAQTNGELVDLNLSGTVRTDIRGFDSVYLTARQFDSPLEPLPGKYNVIVGVSAASIDQQQRQSIVSSLLIAGIAAAVVALLTFFFLQSAVTIPIHRLDVGARIFSRGDFDYRIEPEGGLELRDLGVRFNQMADDLKRYREETETASRTLESRLDERTVALRTVNDVALQISTLLNMSDLLQAVSDLTKENFRLYHAHIYLLDGDNLVLAAGAGEVGQQMVRRGHRIPLKAAQSIVARAARTRQIMLQNDVRSTPDFLPNPLLPETRSEAAMALVARGELLGVLDLQSDQAGYFDPTTTESLLTTLAQQIAIALSNARLFTEVERTGRHEHALGVISDQIQGALSMDEVLEVAARELGKALRVPHTTIQLQLTPEPEPGVPG